MKLIYRGVTYEYDPSQIKSGNLGQPVRPSQSSQAPYTLIYRGVTMQVDPAHLAEPISSPASYDLIYRGTAYQVRRDSTGATTVISQPGGIPKAKPASTPSTMPTHYLSKVHQANLMENLQRRLNVAQEKGDQRLVDLLEAERKQITAWNN